MTKSGKKASSKVSLKDFHNAIPGKVSPEHDLPSKPLGRNGNPHPANEKSAENSAAAAATAAAAAADMLDLVTVLKPQRPAVLSQDAAGAAAKELQSIPLRPQLGPSSSQQRSAAISIQVDCQPPLPAGGVTTGLSPGSLGYSSSFPPASGPESAAAAGGGGEGGPARPLSFRELHGGAPVLQQPPPQKVLASSNHPWKPSPDHLAQQQPPQQQLPPAPAPAALGKSSSGPWSEEAAQAARMQLANSSSSLVEEKKPEPALVKPADPGQRPVLRIQPRTRPVEAAVAADPEAAADLQPQPPPPPPVAEPPAAAAAPLPVPSAAAAAVRPKLNLKPRSKPLEDQGGVPAAGPRGSSPFGEALPREVILNKRGEPLRPEDGAPPPASGKGGGSSGGSGRGPREGAWHTVQHRKGGGGGGGPAPPGPSRAKGHGGRSGLPRAASSPADDPFFGDYIPPSRSFSAVMNGFERSLGFDRPHGLGGFRSGPAKCSSGDDVNPFTKRGLPTRSDDYF